MRISKLRLLYPIHDAPEKEVIKEFFLLIGCLFLEEPIRSVHEAEEALRGDGGSDADIVLDLDVFQWESQLIPAQGQAPPILTGKTRLRDRETPIIVVKCTVPGDGGPHPGERFYHELLETLIRTIWQNRLLL